MSESNDPCKSVRTSALLSAACAGLVGVSAQATVFNESADFSNDVTAATPLPAGTTEVNGVIDEALDFTDRIDAFMFTGLAPNEAVEFEFSGLFTNATSTFVTVEFDADDVPFGAEYNFFQGGVTPGQTVPFSGTVSGVTDASGNVTVETAYGEGGGFSYTYNVTLVPEPGTGTLAMLGAAALLGRRKKRDDRA